MDKKTKTLKLDDLVGVDLTTTRMTQKTPLISCISGGKVYINPPFVEKYVKDNTKYVLTTSISHPGKFLLAFYPTLEKIPHSLRKWSKTLPEGGKSGLNIAHTKFKELFPREKGQNLPPMWVEESSETVMVEKVLFFILNPPVKSDTMMV